MHKSLRRFGLGASRLLPEAATRLGSALRRGPRARNRKQELLGSVSRRLFFETLEPRLLLSADLLPVAGSIATPGAADQHSFALTKETPALFEAQTSGQVQWSLDGPGGQVLSAPSNASGPSANSATPVDLVAGTYTLSIQGVGDATGSYQFHLLDLTAAAANAPATSLADAVASANAAPVSGTTAALTAAQANTQSAHLDQPSANVTASPASTLSRLAFVPNQGQAAPGVDFLATGQNYGLAISSNQWDLALLSGKGNGAEVQMHLLGANPSAPGSGSQQLPDVTNYIDGADSAHAIMGLPSFARVHYGGVYQGIDLEYYGSNGKLEYDWSVAPGADPGAIKLAFNGATGLDLDPQGDLVIHTKAGDLLQQAPVLYQDIGGQRVSISGHYVIGDSNTVGFEVGPYDKSRALTIDPILGYSDYLGGSGKDVVHGIATDKNGNTYVVGTTGSKDFAGLSIPGASTGFAPFSGSLIGFGQAFLSEYRPDGTLLSTSLLGPSAKFDESGYAESSGDAVAVDGIDGSVYVVFDSKAGDTVPPDPNDPRTTIEPLPAPDILHIAKFSSDGTPVFDVATSQFTDATLGTFRGVYAIANVHIALDGTGAAYVSSEILNEDNKGVAAVPFLEKVSKQGQLEFTTALSVAPEALAVDGDKIYIATSTSQAGLPVSDNALQPNNKNPDITNPNTNQIQQGLGDIYLAALDSTGNTLAATYFGGSYYDFVGGLALDPARPGIVYLDGTTSSPDFPVTNFFSGYKPHAIDSNYGGWEGFVSEIDLTNMKLLASTFYGGSNQDPGGRNGSGDFIHDQLANTGTDVLSDIAVKDGRVYVVGMTNSPDLPLVDPIQTELHLHDLTLPGDGAEYYFPGATYDFLVAAFDANLTTLEFSTYLGGSVQESYANDQPPLDGPSYGPVLAVSEDGLIHVAGDTYSPDFPVQGADAGSYAGEGDAVVLTIAQPPTVLGQANHAGVGFPFNGIVASFDNTRPDASPTDFTATIDWGDGTSSAGEVSIDPNLLTKFDVSGTHQYDKVGEFPAVARVTDTKTGLNPQTAIDAGNVAGSQFGPIIAVDPSTPDRLFAAAVDEKGADAANAGTGGGIFVSTSTDGGGTWSPRRIAVDENGEPLPAAFGAPKAVFDYFGNLFLTYVGAAGNDIVLALSTDGGLTFTKLDDLTPQGSAPGKDPNGDVLLSVDHPAIAVGPGSVWLTYQDVADGAVVAVGASVTGPGQVGSFSEFDLPNASGAVGDIAVGPQGQVAVLWQQPDPSDDKTINVYTALKSDGLGTGEFSNPQLLTTTSVSNTGLGFVPSQPDFALAWDPGGTGLGRLYAAYTRISPQLSDPNLTDSVIYLRRSDDGGATWQAPVQVSEAPAGSFQFLPSIAVDSQTSTGLTSTLAVGWYDTRTGDGSQAEYFVATSGDSGSTFSSAARVSAGPSKVGLGDGYGDNSGLAFYNGVLHPVWADNSTNLLENRDLPNLDIARGGRCHQCQQSAPGRRRCGQRGGEQQAFRSGRAFYRSERPRGRRSLKLQRDHQLG
jgi:hypothetical protein